MHKKIMKEQQPKSHEQAKHKPTSYPFYQTTTVGVSEARKQTDRSSRRHLHNLPNQIPINHLPIHPTRIQRSPFLLLMPITSRRPGLRQSPPSAGRHRRLRGERHTPREHRNRRTALARRARCDRQQRQRTHPWNPRWRWCRVGRMGRRGPEEVGVV